MITIIVLLFALFSMRYVARVLFHGLLQQWEHMKQRLCFWRRGPVVERFDGRIWRAV